jgi:hypothetical protein
VRGTLELANGSAIDLTSMPPPEKIEGRPSLMELAWLNLAHWKSGWPREFEPAIKDFRRPGYLTRRHHFIPCERLGAWRRYMRRSGLHANRARMAHGARRRRA